MKITKQPPDPTGRVYYMVSDLRDTFARGGALVVRAPAPGHEAFFFVEEIMLTADELARLATLAAEILMADPAAAFVSG